MPLNIIIDSTNDITFFDSVRRLLGGVDEDTVANEEILDPAFFDIAELELLTLAPCLDSTDLSPADKARSRLAMIYLIASKMCPTVQSRVEYEVKTIDVTWKKSPVKWADLQDSLLEGVDSMMFSIECYTGNVESNVFAIAPSKRAVNDV